ncbi:hypothetical protein WG909_12910 [Peptostreptococcaceae bacterium AGR-M142]
MIFMQGNEVEENKVLINFVHKMPFDEHYGLKKSKEELEKEGYLVETVPEPKELNKIATLYLNPGTIELFYEYEDIPKSREVLLEEQVELLKKVIDGLLLEKEGGLL